MKNNNVKNTLLYYFLNWIVNKYEKKKKSLNYYDNSTDFSDDVGVVGELVLRLLKALSHLCFVLPFEPFDIFLLLTPSGGLTSPVPNNSFCKLKTKKKIIKSSKYFYNNDKNEKY